MATKTKNPWETSGKAASVMTGGGKRTSVKPSDSKPGRPVQGPPVPGKNYDTARYRQITSNKGWKSDPDKVSEANRITGRSSSGTSGGSRGGGSGSGSSSGGGSRPTKPSKPQKATPSTPGPQTTDPTSDDSYWKDLFGPAQREIERQRTLLDQQKAASQAAWDSYAKWAEDKRAEAAGLLTTSQADQQKAYDASRQQSDANIKGYIDAARGGMSQQGADLAQATGSGVLNDRAASISAAGQNNAGYNATMAKIANQRVADQQQINQALATAGRNDIEANYMKGNNALVSKAADLQNTMAQAKLDKYYKDRQYELDKKAAEFLQKYRTDSLTATVQNNNVRNQLAADQQAATQAWRNWQAQLATVKENNRNENTSGDRVAKANKFATDLSAGWRDMNTHEQGQVMQTVARNLRASYPQLTEKQARQIMSAQFGGRFKGQKNAIRDFVQIWRAG